jgi:hypothetical protein
MKKLSFLAVLSSLFFAQAASAVDGLNIGVSVLTSKSDSSDKYDVNGVLFIDYEGYEVALDDDKSLNILPTSIEVSVNGEKVQAYTDAATLSYYGVENLEIAISAISVDYKKFNNFAIRENEELALVDASVTKFFALGTFDIDLTAGLALGGYSKNKIGVNDGTKDYRDTHFYTLDMGAGMNIPVTDTIDLYVYGGYSMKKGENTEMNTTYAGAEMFGGVIAKDITWTPYFEIKKQDYVNSDSGIENMFKTANDTQMLLGIKVRF